MDDTVYRTETGFRCGDGFLHLRFINGIGPKIEHLPTGFLHIGHLCPLMRIRFPPADQCESCMNGSG